MKILSGTEVRNNKLQALSKEIELLKKKNIVPTLVTILNNDSYASSVYVNNKMKLSKQLGINHKLFKLPTNTTNEQMLELIDKLNKDKSINGIFVQLPTSDLIDDNLVINAIDPLKDVDCFNNYNVGKIWTSKNSNDLVKPCTAAGIIEILKYYDIKLDGKTIAIVNRSNIVGKPLAILFLQENATPILCHSHTKDLKEITKKADIVIAAIGKPKFFDQSYFKEDAVLIDVGINRNKDNKVCGDIDFESLKDFKGAITPVPGGVGPMTIAMLIANLLTLTKKQHSK